MIYQIKKKTQAAKLECLKMCIEAGIGHVSSAFSCAEIVSTLYYGVLTIFPENPDSDSRDRFIMSKNHGSVILYPILADLGFISFAESRSFLQNGSSIGIHTKSSVNGIDYAGGSLGIGLGVACGLAHSAKLEKKDYLTYVLLGDGECYEGSIWESIEYAGHKQLNNLIVILDNNQRCITEFETTNTLLNESFASKFKSFNWDVAEVDGHNIGELLILLNNSKRANREAPLCIIAKTIKGYGIPFMEDKPYWHGRSPQGNEAVIALNILQKDFENACK